MLKGIVLRGWIVVRGGIVLSGEDYAERRGFYSGEGIVLRGGDSVEGRDCAKLDYTD